MKLFCLSHDQDILTLSQCSPFTAVRDITVNEWIYEGNGKFSYYAFDKTEALNEAKFRMQEQIKSFQAFAEENNMTLEI